MTEWHSDPLWYVDTGKGRSAYKHRYAFGSQTQAIRYFNCINTHSGYKKRLIGPDGEVIARVIT